MICGRFALGIPKKKLAAHFRVDVPDYRNRANIPPGEPIMVVVQDREGR